MFERVKKNTRSSCESFSSQLCLKTDEDAQVFLSSYSIFNSSIGDECFSFDDEIINSTVYRNALKGLASKLKVHEQSAKSGKPPTVDEPLLDLEELSQDHERPTNESVAALSHMDSNPPKYYTHRELFSDTTTEDLKSRMPEPTGSLNPFKNERQAVVDSSSHAGDNFTKISANETGSNGDVENPTGQRSEGVEPDKSHTIQSQGSRRRTPRSTADDLHSFGKYGVPPMPMQSEIRGSDITRSSILSAQTQTPSLLRKERPPRAKATVQQITQGSCYVVPPSMRIPVSVSGDMGTNDSSIFSADLELVRDKTESITSANHLWGTATNPGTGRKNEVSSEKDNYNEKETSPVEYRNKRRRKRSSAKGSLAFPGHEVPLTESNLVKHNSRKSHRLKFPSQDSKISNPRPDREDKVFIKNVSSNEEKALRQKPRSTTSETVIHDDYDAKPTIAWSNGLLAGTRSDVPERRSRRRIPSKDNGQDSEPSTRHTEDDPAERKPLSELRIKDGNFDSGHPPSLPAGLTPDRGDRVTREFVESAKSRLIFPGLEALTQAQKQVRQGRDCRELTNRKSMASDGYFFGIESSHKLPDHASVIPTSKNLKVPQRRFRRNGNNVNTFEKTVHAADTSSCTIDTSDRLLEDGTTATVPSKTSGDCGNKGREAALTHASSTDLLINTLRVGRDDGIYPT